MIPAPKRSLVPVFLLVAAVPALADRIHKTDGKVIDGVTIEEETLNEVVYKESGSRDRKTVPSEAVLSVEYERMPRLLDEAMAFLQEGDLASAIDNLDQYVDGQIESPSEKRYPWAPAFAAWKACEIRMEVADLPGLVAAAQRLIANFPSSRYLPGAYLAKAGAELQMNKAADSEKTLSGLFELIQSKGLSKRWELECRLAQIQADTKKSGDEKRKDLGTIASQAGSQYPTVRSRANVAQGETYLEEAEAARDQTKAKELRGKAREVFQPIVDDPQADHETLAAAYNGMGDCLFYLGADSGDADLLQQAAMSYLRVVTLYKEQSRYVPRALFYAMRCFDLMQDRRRKNDMKRELASLYPNSRWTSEAQKF